jgi:drug/metabolite transporter (DMT)-like permease
MVANHKVNLKAVAFMVLSALSFAAMNTVVKHVQYLGVFEIVFFRAITSLLICYAMMRYLSVSVVGKENKLLILRSLVGLSSMVFFFWGIQHLPLGIAVSIRYLSPIFATIFALFILREKIKPIQWGFILIAFVGVIIIKDYGGQINTFGLIITMISAVLSGMVYGLISLIGTRDHFLVIVFYVMLCCTIVGGIVSAFYWVAPIATDWWPLLGMGVFGFFGQIFMTSALQMEQANRIVPLKYSEVIFTLISGAVFFADSYTLFSLVGIFLIISALIGNLMVKHQS